MSLEVVSCIVHHLVTDPDALELQAQPDGRGIRIEVRCSAADAGRIIGRGGRIINSIRTLARAASEGQQRVEVQLIE